MLNKLSIKELDIYNRLRWIKKKLIYIFFLNFYKSTKSKEKYIKKKFKESLEYEIDFSKDPITFNQKIQFRKLYDHNPLYSVCADKYGAREYIKSKVGEEYLIPIYLVTDKLTEEQWEKLPNSFKTFVLPFSPITFLSSSLSFKNLSTISTILFTSLGLAKYPL